MAIYTGGMRQKEEQLRAADDIAAQKEKAMAGESKRKGRAGIFGKLAGMGIGHLAGLALAGVTGGIVNPMTLKLAQAAITGGSAWLGRAGAHQATTGKSFLGKILKTPGQVDKIVPRGKYGYGKEKAETLSQALIDERTSKEDLGTLAGSIGGILATDIAGEMGEKFSGNLTKILKGDKGKGEDLIGLSRATGVAGIEKSPFDYTSTLSSPAEKAPFDYTPSLAQTPSPLELELPQLEGAMMEAIDKRSPAQGLSSMISKAAPTEEMSPMFSTQGLKSSIQDYFSPGRTYNANTGQYEYQGGGQVPNQEEAFMELLSLVQPQQQEEEKQQPSIADYFASQGKTLGGNNTQSLSQILGR